MGMTSVRCVVLSTKTSVLAILLINSVVAAIGDICKSSK